VRVVYGCRVNNPHRTGLAKPIIPRHQVIRQGMSHPSDSRLQVVPLDLLEGEDHLMSFTHVTAESEDGKVDVMMADAMRFDDSGRVVEFWTLSNDQRAVDAFIG
jgi:hypothetical protein